MYMDPARIRSHVVKIRLSDQEADLINALVNFTGEQRAVLLRDLLLEQARAVLIGDQRMRVGWSLEGAAKARCNG
jgi:hypothetical protein